MVYFWSKGFRLFLIFNLSYVFAAFFTFIHSLDERWITKDCVSTARLFLRGFRDWTRAVNVHTVYINERTKIDNGKVKGGFISLLKRKENLVGLISFVIKSLVGIHPVVNKFPCWAKVIKRRTITYTAINTCFLQCVTSVVQARGCFEIAMKRWKKSSKCIVIKIVILISEQFAGWTSGTHQTKRFVLYGHLQLS